MKAKNNAPNDQKKVSIGKKNNRQALAKTNAKKTKTASRARIMPVANGRVFVRST
jgi:hypothetical protein